MGASSIRTVLTAIREARVRALLMGGQACILYGAAEFSRDTGIAVVADAENLARLAKALRALNASVTAIPPFTADVLARGHAVHFRCAAADNTRLDVMARMRNVAPFDECWERRTTSWLDGVGEIEVLVLADLVACKKTRRGKDWPMIRRSLGTPIRTHALVVRAALAEEEARARAADEASGRALRRDVQDGGDWTRRAGLSLAI